MPLNNHIKSLDGLRGLAAIIVFISHSANHGLLPSVLGSGFGKVGVMVFFVLSGFLMASLYLEKPATLAAQREYFVARFGRVFPLYYFILLVSLCVSVWGGWSSYPFNYESAGAFIRSLFLIDAVSILWTIPVEIQFYLLFVIFWAIYQVLGWGRWAPLFVIFSMIPAVVVFAANGELPRMVFSYSYAFFVGVFSNFIFQKMKESEVTQSFFDRAGFVFLILLLLNLPELRAEFGLIGSGFFKTWGDPLTWLLVWLLFMASVFESKSLSLLRSKFFVYMGSISYGVYLLHYPILLFFVEWIGGFQILAFWGAGIFTLLVAHCSLLYFEKPLAKVIRNTFGAARRQA